MVSKDFQFYVELIIVTILALVSANLWIDFAKNTVRHIWGKKLFPSFIVSTIVTLCVIGVLWYFFSEDTQTYENSDENLDDESMLDYYPTSGIYSSLKN